jgi:hypothetical protein
MPLLAYLCQVSSDSLVDGGLGDAPSTYTFHAPPPRFAPRVLRRAELCAEPLSSLPAVLKSQFLFSVGSSSRIRFAVGGKGQGFEQSIKD